MIIQNSQLKEIFVKKLMKFISKMGVNWVDLWVYIGIICA
jgi:hypothetical protein